jgi:hypothetical protein
MEKIARSAARISRASRGVPNYMQGFVEEFEKEPTLSLLTRVMKGCYVYFTNKHTDEYFRKRMER